MPFVYEEQQYVRKRGNRREVLDGIAYCTSGGLCAADLEERNGKIISKKRSAMGKQRYAVKNPFRPVEDEKKEVVSEVPPKKRKRKKKVSIVVPPKPQPVQPEKMLRVPVARKRRGGGRLRK
mgnify:CR=1 FL=1